MLIAMEMRFALVSADLSDNIVMMFLLQLLSQKLLLLKLQLSQLLKLQSSQLLKLQSSQLLKLQSLQLQKHQSQRHQNFQNRHYHQLLHHHNVQLTQHHHPKINKSVLLILQQSAIWLEMTSGTKVIVWIWSIKGFTRVFWKKRKHAFLFFLGEIWIKLL